MSLTYRYDQDYIYTIMTYYQVCNKSNTTGDTSGVGTAYPSGF